MHSLFGSQQSADFVRKCPPPLLGPEVTHFTSCQRLIVYKKLGGGGEAVKRRPDLPWTLPLPLLALSVQESQA